jgi:hypothetical protein
MVRNYKCNTMYIPVGVGWVIPGEFGTRVKVPGEAQVQVWSTHPIIYNNKFLQNNKIRNKAIIIKLGYNTTNLN